MLFSKKILFLKLLNLSTLTLVFIVESFFSPFQKSLRLLMELDVGAILTSLNTVSPT